MDFTYPANLRFECNRCGLCCGDTNKKQGTFFFLEAKLKKSLITTCQPLTDFSSAIADKAPYVYEMKKSSEGKCVFLKENRCSIYPLRPLICMFYPFELKFAENTEFHNFDFTVECPAIGKGKV